MIRNSIKKRFTLVLCSCLTTLFSICANPLDANEKISNVPLYYSLGGAQAIDSPATFFSHLQQLQNNGEDSGFLCGNFKPSLDIQDMLTDQLSETLATLNSIPAAVTSALPGYVLCRAQPGLCQLLQHYVVRAENMWNLSVKSCEDMMESVTQARNPFHDLVQVSKMQTWQKQAQAGSNAAEAERQANKTDGCVRWVGGKNSGCKGKEPIWLTADTAKTGWCLIQDLDAECSGNKLPNQSGTVATITETWSSPNDAARWISDVLGDYKIQVGDQSSTKAGTGLLPKIEEETQTIFKALHELVYSSEAPTDADLDRLSTNRLFLTAPLIDALRDLPDRKLLIHRIANEVALARVVQKALLARRILLTGVMEPNIQSAGNITESIHQNINILEREIDTITFEIQVSRRLVSDSILNVLGAHNSLTAPSPNVRKTPEFLLQ